MEDFDLPQVLAQAWAILKNVTSTVEQAAVAAQLPCCMSRGIYMQTRCYECDGPNHRACDCKLPEVQMPSSKEPSHTINASDRDTLPGTVWKTSKGVRILRQSPPQSTCKGLFKSMKYLKWLWWTLVAHGH